MLVLGKGCGALSSPTRGLSPGQSFGLPVGQTEGPQEQLPNIAIVGITYFTCTSKRY